MDHGTIPTNPLIARLRSLTRLSGPDLLRLEQACAPARDYAAQADIVCPGVPSDRFHILVEGWAARYKLLSDGRRPFPAVLLPGDVCDLDGLLLPRNHSGVCALTPCTVATLPHTQVRALVDGSPAIRDAFWRLGCLENAISAEWSVGLGRRSADERLTHLLCELFVRLRAVGLGTVDGYAFPLTQPHLADALGLSAVHVNRTMRELQDDGMITVEKRRLTIHDYGALRAKAGFDAGYLFLDDPRPSASAGFQDDAGHGGRPRGAGLPTVAAPGPKNSRSILPIAASRGRRQLMPRYFFHRADGGFSPDPEGTVLQDLRAARSEAVRYAAGTMRDRPDWIWDGKDFRIEVTDERGLLLCTVVVLGIDAPATRGSRAETG